MSETFTKEQKDSMVNYKIFPVSNMRLRDLTDIKIPSAAISFDASDNILTDFTGFECPDTIEGVVFDNNPLVSFKNFPEFTKITSFSAKGSPLSLLPNFKQLVLLVVGPQVKFVNGERLSSQDYYSVSPQTLAGFYFGSDANRKSNDEKQNICDQLADALRRGWISDKLPRQPQVAEDESTRQEDDSVSTRAVRLTMLLKWSDSAMLELIHNIFNEIPDKKASIRVPKQTQIDQQLERQRILIISMEDEIKILQQQQQLRDEYKKKSRVNLSDPEPKISPQSMELYLDMLQKFGSEVEKNADDVEIQKNIIDPEGLRRTVKKFLQVPESTEDKVLIRMLKQKEREAEKANQIEDDEDPEHQEVEETEIHE